MAPEQISKKKFGHKDWRTDIWQMGVMIYELLTRELPFVGEGYQEIKEKDGKARRSSEKILQNF